jgi:hypothetical protein
MKHYIILSHCHPANRELNLLHCTRVRSNNCLESLFNPKTAYIKFSKPWTSKSAQTSMSSIEIWDSRRSIRHCICYDYVRNMENVKCTQTCMVILQFDDSMILLYVCRWRVEVLDSWTKRKQTYTFFFQDTQEFCADNLFLQRYTATLPNTWTCFVTVGVVSSTTVCNDKTAPGRNGVSGNKAVLKLQP